MMYHISYLQKTPFFNSNIHNNQYINKLTYSIFLMKLMDLDLISLPGIKLTKLKTNQLYTYKSKANKKSIKKMAIYSNHSIINWCIKVQIILKIEKKIIR